MNDAEARRQIAQMVEFIKQEAREKAEEIRVKTDQEFNIATLAHVERAKQEVRDEFARERTSQRSHARVARSTLVSRARAARTEKQHQIVERIKAEASQRLVKVSEHPEYKRLLSAMLVQGLVALRETNVVVRCRKEDGDVVEGILDEAASTYSEVMARDVGGGISFATKLIVDTETYLAHGPGAKGVDDNAFTCAGGVELLAHNAKIVVNNTLDARLDLCFEQLKPAIRSMLFDSSPTSKAS